MNNRIKEFAKDNILREERYHKMYAFYTEELDEFVEKIFKECIIALEEMPRYARKADHKRLEEATIKDCIFAIKNVLEE